MPSRSVWIFASPSFPRVHYILGNPLPFKARVCIFYAVLMRLFRSVRDNLPAIF